MLCVRIYSFYYILSKLFCKLFTYCIQRLVSSLYWRYTACMSFTESSHTWSKKTEKILSNQVQERLFDHVMCFGTFDIFHPGHIFYLTETAKLAKKMTIVIARDTRVTSLKWRSAEDDEETRRKNVEQAFPDAQVILWDEHDIFAPLRTYSPDILAFGYDQRVPEAKIHELFPTLQMRRIGGFEPEKWKSSKLRKN